MENDLITGFGASPKECGHDAKFNGDTRNLYKTAMVNKRFIREKDDRGNLSLGFCEGDFVSVDFKGYHTNKKIPLYEISGEVLVKLPNQLYPERVWISAYAWEHELTAFTL